MVLDETFLLRQDMESRELIIEVPAPGLQQIATNNPNRIALVLFCPSNLIGLNFVNGDLGATALSFANQPVVVFNWFQHGQLVQLPLWGQFSALTRMHVWELNLIRG